MKTQTFKVLVLMLVGLWTLTSCRTTKPRREKAALLDLDHAMAQLAVDLATDSKWNEYCTEYGKRVEAAREANNEAFVESEDGVPVILIAQIENGLQTQKGRAVNYKFVIGRFMEITGSSMKLKEFLVGLDKEGFKEELAVLSNRLGEDWPEELPSHPLLRWSVYAGKEENVALDLKTYVEGDPLVDKTGLKEEGTVKIPELALVVTMTQQTFDDATGILFDFYIAEIIGTEGSRGTGLILWHKNVRICAE